MYARVTRPFRPGGYEWVKGLARETKRRAGPLKVAELRQAEQLFSQQSQTTSFLSNTKERQHSLK